MDDRRPAFLRPTDGRSGTPLLYKPDRDSTEPASTLSVDVDRGRSGFNGPHRRPSPNLPHTPTTPRSTMPTLSRRSTMRSQSPPSSAAVQAARRKYTYAGIFLVVSLLSFTIQTELAWYVQQAGWAKPYCMLYLTHGSWAFLWPVQLLILRIQKRDVPWPVFWRRHVWLVRTTAIMVERHDLDLPRGYGERSHSPWRYMVRATAGITSALTVAGLSWYIAVNMTTPSDLTAIYNCSAFFAYAFSVPLLKEKLRLGKSVAVAIAIAGVLVVAYGDGNGVSTPPPPASPPVSPPGEVEVGGHALSSRAMGGGSSDPATRFIGNVVIGAGSVLYGLYEVLYKRFACPPDGCSPNRGMIFANTFGSLIGLFTLSVLWIPLPLLHITGLETFELPTGRVAWYLFVSVVMNATFAGSFLVLISLTSPVLSSVASLLTIFTVALADWFVKRQPLGGAAIMGGGLIVVAFLMLSYSSYREMEEEEARKKMVDMSGSESDEEEEEEDEYEEDV
ncbi:hypothetical protein MCOR02_011978 [Pyricularia oryzae]|uniref:Uncharacterized protein n=2 Tax=Pyricularia oryzae TaxID=318829 RepID=A0A4P7NEA9_PYROR|nr:hypothetical protein MCOR02_011978 [Pyricularia oryzae]KAI6288399.1 hypothetical protein MCOR26_000001 [Pyricularia oryzae]KAI6299693.1 hypothetical protein MCOR34_009149 [Pyricularia oryzae]KAI6322834.1 hypothetical protein MCOR30_007465 [Pyricularia oryzae]KAI6342821.1 hypothetical protein MCOR28_005127 [Pyricularia oryzae]